MTTRMRFLSDYYDSVHQRSRQLSSEDKEAGLFTFLGRLRLDTILSKTLVITDAMLLDGTMFLEIDPDILLECIRRNELEIPPLEVRVRAGTLQESLVRFLKKPSLSNLNPFVFSVIQDEKRRELVSTQLATLSSSRLESVSDVPDLLIEAGLTIEDKERLDAAWCKWFEMVEAGKLAISPWSGDFLLDVFLGDPKTHNSKLITDEGKKFASWAYSVRPDRGPIDTRLMSLLRDVDPDVALDFLSTRTWFYRGYNRAIAHQHSCDNYESLFQSLFQLITSDDGESHDNGTSGYRLIELPLDFLYRLGQIPNAHYEYMFINSRSHLEKWWASADDDALRKGIEPFIESALDIQSVPPVQRLIRDSAYGGVGGLIGALGGLIAGPLGILVGGVTGAIAGCVVSYFIEKSERKPIPNLTERIIEYTKKRVNNGKND